VTSSVTGFVIGTEAAYDVAMRFAPIFLSGLIGLSFAACSEDEQPQLKTEEQSLTAAQRLAHATAIRDVARGEGLTNGAVLGGIAVSETGLVHCWQDAQWACKGPNSPSCGGGPVIAGAGDGPCSLKQGGLGMFQFDGGTFSQTIARDGEDVLLLEGNIAQAVEFVTDKVIQDIDGVTNREQALAWINAVPMVRGDARTEKWASLLACRYNGCCNASATCTSRRAKYRDNAIDIFNEYGAEFWNGGGSTNSQCTPVPAEGGVIETDTGCYAAGGAPQFWRKVSSATANGGELYWTMTTDNATASNFASWSINVANPGKYIVEVHLDGGEFGQSTQAKYQVTHAGGESTVLIDQSADTGFVVLGEYEFTGAAGEGVMLSDNTGEASATMTKLLFDAIRVSPSDGSTTGVPPGTEPPDSEVSAGCSATGSSTGSIAGTALMLMAVFGAGGLRRRRR
jgi:MYXO-CTERM domain-containing protein